MSMHPEEARWFEAQAEVMRERRQAKAAEQARTAALAGPRADELVELERKADRLRDDMTRMLQQSGLEGRTLDYAEAAEYDQLAARLDVIEGQAKSIVLAHRPA